MTRSTPDHRVSPDPRVSSDHPERSAESSRHEVEGRTGPLSVVRKAHHEKCAYVAVATLFLALTLLGCSPPVSFVDAHDDALTADTNDTSIDIAPPDACADAAPSRACPICTPGATACSADGHATLRCGDDGASLATALQCADGQLCRQGACVDPCADAVSRNAYEGCEFWATNTINSALGHSLATQDRDSFPFAVVVTNAWPVTAHVVVESRSLAASIAYDVPPHDARRIDLPWVLALAEGVDRAHPRSAIARGAAVHLRSDLPLAAYQFNPANYFLYAGCEGPQCFSYTNDASLLLPANTLREQYIAMTRPTVRLRAQGDSRWRTSSGFVTVVATRDATHVTLRSTAHTLAGDGVITVNPGEATTTTLDAGDVLQVLSFADERCTDPEPAPGSGDIFCRPDPTEDLTGSIVASDAPVAVFSGHDCALVPYNRYACDHLEEQLFPVESLGRHYLVAPTPSAAMEPNLLRIVAVRANTSITFSPASVHAPVTLAASGDSIEFEVRQPVEINASDAVEVAQFLVGANFDPSNPIPVNGDPDMVLVPPVEQFESRYEFVTARDFTATTAIIIAPHGEPLLFDDAPLLDPPVASVGGYDIFHRRQLQGPHRVEAVHPAIRIGLTVSGLDKYCSYTYPGGLALTAISPPL